MIISDFKNFYLKNFKFACFSQAPSFADLIAAAGRGRRGVRGGAGVPRGAGRGTASLNEPVLDAPNPVDRPNLRGDPRGVLTRTGRRGRGRPPLSQNNNFVARQAASQPAAERERSRSPQPGGSAGAVHPQPGGSAGAVHPQPGGSADAVQRRRIQNNSVRHEATRASTRETRSTRYRRMVIDSSDDDDVDIPEMPATQ